MMRGVGIKVIEIKNLGVAAEKEEETGHLFLNVMNKSFWKYESHRGSWTIKSYDFPYLSQIQCEWGTSVGNEAVYVGLGK